MPIIRGAQASSPAGVGPRKNNSITQGKKQSVRTSVRAAAGKKAEKLENDYKDMLMLRNANLF